MTLNMKDLETAMKAAETAAVTNDGHGQWFDSGEEYEEWAGDVFQCLFEQACKAIGISFEEEETYIPDDVDESNYNPYTGCDEYEVEPFDEEW